MVLQMRAEGGARSAPPRIRCFPLLRTLAGKHVEVQKRRRREVCRARSKVGVMTLRTRGGFACRHQGSEHARAGSANG